MSEQEDLFAPDSTAIVPSGKSEMVSAGHSPAQDIMGLIQGGMERGIEPEKMEKMLDLYERMLAKTAQAEFVQAHAEFQSRCPTIRRTKEVRNRNGMLLYRYEPLEGVVAQVRGLLVDLGFSFSFDVAEEEKGIIVSCLLRHRGGHQEVTRIPVPSTKGINTNAAQDKGIQITFGKRYAFLGALGITTADEDTDGQVQNLRPITEGQVERIEQMVKEAGADLGMFLSYMNAEKIAEIQEEDYDKAIAALHQKMRSKK